MKIIKLILLQLFILCLSAFNTYSQKLHSGEFYQEYSQTISLPPQAGLDVIKLFKNQDRIKAITSHGIFYYQNEKWTGRPYVSGIINASIDKGQTVWMNNDKTIWSEKGERIPNPPRTHARQAITATLWLDKNSLLTATTHGLYLWNGSWEKDLSFPEIKINAITQDSEGTVWIASDEGLWQEKSTEWLDIDKIGLALGHNSQYLTVTTGLKGDDILFSSPKAIAALASDGNHWLKRGADGLPYGPATTILETDSLLWIGTAKGLIRKGKNWRYYTSKRWLVDDQINDILAIEPGKVWVATPNGISEIGLKAMTLEEKANGIEDIIEKRHNRIGIINRSKLAISGDINSSFLENQDNDGLWTSCYLIAESFRYAVTKSEDAKAKAKRTFEALERLETVTGIPGYPARSYVRSEDLLAPSRSPHPKNWHPSPDGEWQWLDDTSSDEIVGHLFSMALYHDFVADEADKEKVVDLIDRIVSHIVDNDLQLIDYDGKPTRWAIWTPDSLNRSSNWYYEKGLNSLQILSSLQTAYHFTGKTKYKKVYQHLIEKEGYAQNALQAKMTDPFDISHSDDILNFFPYYNLLKYTPKEDPNYPLYLQSLQRSWKAVQTDNMPVWNVIASALLKEDKDLNIALHEIQTFPLDMITWSIDNSHRWDLRIDEFPGRGRSPQAYTAIPSPEGNTFRWNTNPKQLKISGGGKTEVSGTYYLVAYWMGRYYEYWE
ncbi:hypothetical protein GCM10027284_30630 [Cyclobacterium sediminis]